MFVALPENLLPLEIFIIFGEKTRTKTTKQCTNAAKHVCNSLLNKREFCIAYFIYNFVKTTFILHVQRIWFYPSPFSFPPS